MLLFLNYARVSVYGYRDESVYGHIDMSAGTNRDQKRVSSALEVQAVTNSPAGVLGILFSANGVHILTSELSFLPPHFAF